MKKTRTTFTFMGSNEFGIYSNLQRKAKDIYDLFDKMPKYLHRQWQSISWTDEDGDEIELNRHIMDDAGWNIETTIGLENAYVLNLNCDWLGVASGFAAPAITQPKTN